jgi:hypothetical protein
MFSLIRRYRWLKAWRSVVISGYGDLKMRKEYAYKFNQRKFWFQNPLTDPEK